MFYWVLTIIILIIVAILTDIPTACLFTSVILTIKYINQENCLNNYETALNKSCDDKPIEPVYVENIEPTSESTPKKILEKTSEDNVIEEVNIIDPQILIDNENTLDQILNPDMYTTDDKIFDASVNSGYKDKKAKEIRSHWNNDNWKRYYDYEFGIHETENRDWWTDNDYEINQKHVVI
jgi:hypothetical protein